MENYRKSMLLVILQWAVPIILFLSAFFLEHVDYIYNSAAMSELGFFYLLFTPFDYGVIPTIYPLSVNVIAFAITKRSNKFIVWKTMFVVSIAYLILCILSFLMSSGKTGDYLLYSVGATTQYLALTWNGMPYLFETMVSLCTYSAVIVLLRSIIRNILHNDFYATIINTLVFLSINSYLPNAGLGKWKPYCIAYTWIGSHNGFVEKYIIQAISIGLLLLILLCTKQLKNKNYKFEIKKVMLYSVVIGALCGVYRQYIFFTNINAFEALITTMQYNESNNVGRYEEEIIAVSIIITGACGILKYNRENQRKQYYGKSLAMCIVYILLFELGIFLSTLLHGKKIDCVSFGYIFEIASISMRLFAGCFIVNRMCLMLQDYMDCDMCCFAILCILIINIFITIVMCSSVEALSLSNMRNYINTAFAISMCCIFAFVNVIQRIRN